ncbi:MAG: LPS export ABC transporter periplasmic protein LptC [Armatimonadetes bacterium]|nr:LPS export ABC transporter periplasmic protein LptC [Armatimonadota bacterium]
MRVRWLCTVLAAVVALGACVGIAAQQAKKSTTQKKEPETVQGRADVLKSTWGDKTEVLMKGNVKFTSDDMVLTSDLVTYDKQTKTAVSPGKLTITSNEADMTGDKGTADFNKRLGTLSGNVEMLLKPKPEDQANDDEDSVRAQVTKPTTITCENLEYLYQEKIATATGGVHFKQDKRTAQAQKAVYNSDTELLMLTGEVKGVDEDGQTFSAPSVTISLKRGDEWMEAQNASASFKIDLDELEDEE